MRVGQVVGVENAGFAISFITDIIDGNYAGAIGLYLGTILCGPPCGTIGEIVFTIIGGHEEEKKAKRELRETINGLLAEARANAVVGVDEAVRLAAEQGLCSTVPPIQIPAPADPELCNQRYQAGNAKLDAIAACGHRFDITYTNDNNSDELLEIVLNDPPGCVAEFVEPVCGAKDDCEPVTPVCRRITLEDKSQLTEQSLADGRYDDLTTCEEPNQSLSAGDDAHRLWLETMWYECLKERPGDHTLHHDPDLLAWHVRHAANLSVGGDPEGAQRIEQLAVGGGYSRVGTGLQRSGREVLPVGRGHACRSMRPVSKLSRVSWNRGWGRFG